MLHVSEKKTLKARSPPAVCPRPSNCQRVARRVRKAYLRKIRQMEYRKLQAIVPAVASKDKVAKVRSEKLEITEHFQNWNRWHAHHNALQYLDM